MLCAYITKANTGNEQDLPEWSGLDAMLQEQIMHENPVYVSEEMKNVVDSVSTFSFKPMGLITDCVVSSDLLQGSMPQSFSRSYIVNPAEDA